MCFSAEASFAAGAALIPAGGYCMWSAWRKQPRFMGLAVLPLFFGIQQISEGFVWLSLSSDDPYASKTASLVFLFFALAFWPFWFPLFAALMEPLATRRRILAVVTLLASAWFWVLFFPLLRDPNLLETVRDHHSIRYNFTDNLVIYQYVPIWLMRVLYFCTLAAPFVIGSQRWGTLPGLMLAASVVVAALIFDYAFVSVWCFFAAVMALYLCVIFYRLPQPVPAGIRSQGQESESDS